MIRISRRRFLTLTGGLFATGCTASGANRYPAAAPPPSATDGSTPASTAAPTTTIPTTVTTVTTVDAPAELVPDDRVLVMIELAGGNDAVNTLVPLTGVYHDLRPTIALPEAELVHTPSLPDHALHPALEPLTSFLDDERLAVIAGIGFPDPDRSHFVSTDRWLRADRMDQTQGWLGRWLDLLPDDLPALGAAALGGSSGILLGADRSGTRIDEADAFAFPSELSNAAIRTLTEPVSDDPLHAAAQAAFVNAIGAVEEFDVVADAVRSELMPAGDSIDGRAGGAFATGLAVAAQLVVGEVGTRVVTVRAQGFDTHAEQVGVHADLLTDLADGLTAFWRTVDDAGHGDRVLVSTHSEFGRRVRENASEGCDHGAAGVSFLMGDGVAAGLHGSIDTGDLVDGDLRPQIDPRAMFTACLDWLGGDVETILGRRYDDVPLLA